MQKEIPLVILVSIVIGLSGALFAISDTPADWWGSVTINGTNSPNGTVVEAFVDGTFTANATTGVGIICSVSNCSNYYLLHVAGSNGSNVTFKVYGVSVNESNQSWLLGSRELNLTMTKLANSNACYYNIACSSGLCVHGYCRASNPFCGDSFCDSGESCTADNSGCSSGYACSNGCQASGGGGGGGGGGGTTTPSTEVIEKVIIPTASSDTPAIAIVNSTNAETLKIQEVSVELTQSVSNVQITIQQTSKPSGASDPVPSSGSGAGVVYKYVDVSSNMSSDAINKTKISFKVEKSWVISNNIDESKVYMYRYVGSTWTKLTTAKLSENLTYIFYQAESPGLSTFVITGEKISEPGKQACPYECCLGETTYLDKVCYTGSECQSNKCAAIVEQKVCPTCSECSEWSSCDRSVQTRTCYKCSADTSYACQAYTTTQTCESGEPAVPLLPISVIIIVVLILVGVGGYLHYHKVK